MEHGIVRLLSERRPERPRRSIGRAMVHSQLLPDTITAKQLQAIYQVPSERAQ